MKSIENLKNIENKNVILRLDLNVPIKNGKITDTNRIDKILPTLNYLVRKKAKIIIILQRTTLQIATASYLRRARATAAMLHSSRAHTLGRRHEYFVAKNKFYHKYEVHFPLPILVWML